MQSAVPGTTLNEQLFCDCNLFQHSRLIGIDAFDLGQLEREELQSYGKHKRRSNIVFHAGHHNAKGIFFAQGSVVGNDKRFRTGGTGFFKHFDCVILRLACRRKTMASVLELSCAIGP